MCQKSEIKSMYYYQKEKYHDTDTTNEIQPKFGRQKKRDNTMTSVSPLRLGSIKLLNTEAYFELS